MLTQQAIGVMEEVGRGEKTLPYVLEVFYSQYPGFRWPKPLVSWFWRLMVYILPGSLTVWPLKIWLGLKRKVRIVFQPSFLRGYVKIWGDLANASGRKLWKWTAGSHLNHPKLKRKSIWTIPPFFGPVSKICYFEPATWRSLTSIFFRWGCKGGVGSIH